MPSDSRSQRKELLNRRQSARIASRALKTAVSELSPANKLKLYRQPSDDETFPTFRARARIHIIDTDTVAYSSNPVTFGVAGKDNPGRAPGKLLTDKPLGAARHEIAHRLGAGHGAIAAAGGARYSGEQGKPGDAGLAAALQRGAPGRRHTQLLQENRRRQPPLVSAVSSRKIAGFNTKTLTNIINEGRPVAAAKARQLSRRLGVRMRARGVDF